MRGTDTERNLVIRQFRRAREELVRATLMMQGLATDAWDAQTVFVLKGMAWELALRIDGILKADSPGTGDASKD